MTPDPSGLSSPGGGVAVPGGGVAVPGGGVAVPGGVCPPPLGAGVTPGGGVVGGVAPAGSRSPSPEAHPAVITNPKANADTRREIIELMPVTFLNQVAGSAATPYPWRTRAVENSTG